MMDLNNSEKNNFKVTLENFQSISSGSLEFEQGINTIIGQSNSGKSAILRAIKGVIMNPSGSQKYIKNGTKGFKVVIDYNGNTIEWSRDKSPKYVINGEEYKKVGGEKLDSLLDNSGFSVYENKQPMNVESELELPFPFDKNSTELFKLFEKNIFCVSDSTAITKLIKDDESEIANKKAFAEVELERYKDKLQAVEYIEKEVDLNKLIEGRNSLAVNIKDRDTLVSNINSLKRLVKEGKALSIKVVPLDNVDVNVISSYVELLNNISKLDSICKAVKVLEVKYKGAGDIRDTSEYTGLANDINKLLKVEKLMSILRPVGEPTMHFTFKEYTSLRDSINSLSELREQAKNVQVRIKQLKEDIIRLENEKKEFKVCPLCGGELENV